MVVSTPARRVDDRLEYRLTHTVLKHRSAGMLRLRAVDAASAPSAKPVIILHGLGSAKERMLSNVYAFAAAGFDVAAFDLFLHGDRPEAIYREQLLSSDFVTAMRDIIYETAGDVPSLCQEAGIDMQSAGILGISAGGFVAHALATQRPRCRALVAAISSPDWLNIDPSRTPDPGSPEGMLLAAYSPVNSPQSYVPLPVCLLNGELDDVVLSIGSRRLYERLLPLYREQGCAESLDLTVYPDAGHYFTDDMLAKSVEWFRRFV